MRIPHSTAIIHRSMMAYPICSSEQSLVRKRIRGSKKVDDSPPGYFQRHSSRFFRCGRGHLRQTRNIRRGKNRVASCRKLRHEAARFFMPYLEAQKSGERKTPAPLGCKRSSAAFRLHPAGCPAARHSVKGKGAAFFQRRTAFLPYADIFSQCRKRRRNKAGKSLLSLLSFTEKEAGEKEGAAEGRGRKGDILPEEKSCGRTCREGNGASGMDCSVFCIGKLTARLVVSSSASGFCISCARTGPCTIRYLPAVTGASQAGFRCTKGEIALRCCSRQRGRPHVPASVVLPAAVTGKSR